VLVATTTFIGSPQKCSNLRSASPDAQNKACRGSLKRSANNALADAIKRHAKTTAPHRHASKPFFSTRENKCAVFAGKFRELSIKNEQNSPLKKNMDVTIL
jgi:hypothetical protein